MRIHLPVMFGLAACAIDTPVDTATDQQAINTTSVNATSSAGGGTETQVAVVPAALDLNSGRILSPTLVEAYNGLTAPAWSVSTDYAFSFAPTFPLQTNEVASPFASPGSVTMSDMGTYRSSAGQPALVATGSPGQVVYFSVSNSTLAPAMDITAAVSNDGGRTFGNTSGGMFGFPGFTWVISTKQSSGADPTGGMVDEPVATVEGSTHVIWVAWANGNTQLNGGGKRVWVRRVHIDFFGLFDNRIIDQPVEVRIDCNLSCVKFDTFKIAATCSTPNVDDCGHNTSTPGVETLVITFPRVNEGGDTELLNNQAVKTCAQTIDVEWRAAISKDGGMTWKKGLASSDGSEIIDTDPLWPNCIVPGATAIAGNNRGHIPVVHDDVTGLWHLYYTRSIPFGTTTHQRIFHVVLDDNFLRIGGGPEELAPEFTDYNTQLPCFGPECPIDQFLPAASSANVSATSSSHAVAWHDTRRDPTTPRGTMWGAFSCRSGAIGTFHNQELTSGRGVPWAFTGTNGNTPWGDYEGMASDVFGGLVTWYPAWADNRLGGTTSRIFTRGWMPDCAM